MLSKHRGGEQRQATSVARVRPLRLIDFSFRLLLFVPLPVCSYAKLFGPCVCVCPHSNKSNAPARQFIIKRARGWRVFARLIREIAFSLPLSLSRARPLDRSSSPATTTADDNAILIVNKRARDN